MTEIRLPAGTAPPSSGAGSKKKWDGAFELASSSAGPVAPSASSERPPSAADEAWGHFTLYSRKLRARFAKTAVEGVKTFGHATAGLFRGGTEEAKARWKEGAQQTKETARDGRDETRQQGEVPKCR